MKTPFGSWYRTNSRVDGELVAPHPAEIADTTIAVVASDTRRRRAATVAPFGMPRMFPEGRRLLRPSQEPMVSPPWEVCG